jgi:2-aminoadipate transaminase
MSSTAQSLFSTRSAGFKPSAIREILKVTETPEIISFAGGLPAPELFPVEALAAAAADVLAEDGPAALQYGPSEGYRPLREWIARHVAATTGLSVRPEEILITAGSQQGLDLVAKILLDPGDIVLTENPAYLGALQAFRAYEADVVGLSADSEGMDPAELRHFLLNCPRRPKLLYLVPNFQNPTGTSTSLRRRAELAEVAAEFSLPILEDDPYGSLRYAGAAVPALASRPGAADCLYLGTVSKILAPGLRVAWIAARNRAFYDRLLVAKQSCDLHTSSLTQRIVERYVAAPGRLGAHIASLCSVYRARRDTMLAALARTLPAGSRWTQPDGGLFLWARLPGGWDTAALLPRAIAAQVAFVPGAPFWVGTDERATLRLNFSNSTPEQIVTGVARLGQALSAR